MAKHEIKEVSVTPPLPPDYVVFRREDIYRFVAAARRTAADLHAQLEAERALHAAVRGDEVIAPVDVPIGPYRKPLFSLPDWTEPAPHTPQDNAAFFASLRETDDPLIAGADDPADTTTADDDDTGPAWVYHRTVGRHPAGTQRFA